MYVDVPAFISITVFTDNTMNIIQAVFYNKRTHSFFCLFLP